MAAVVDDSTVMYNTYTGSGFNRDTSNAKNLGKAVDSGRLAANPPSGTKAGGEQGVQKQAALAAVVSDKKPGADSSIASNNKPPTANRRPPTIKSGIKKLREVSLKISRKIVYQDIGKDGLADTITLFVFFETTPDSLTKKAPATAVALTKPAKAVDTSNQGKAQSHNKPAAKSGETTCTQIATDDDVAFLRSAILKANSEHEKIGVASERLR